MISIALINNHDIHIIIALLMELNPAIGQSVLNDRLQDMVASGYKCVGVYDDDTLIGISGLWILVKYYIGKHFEMDNVYIKPQYRNAGIGKALIAWVDAYGKEQGCVGGEINCYVGNTEAHRFWERSGYEKIAFHFQKKI